MARRIFRSNATSKLLEELKNQISSNEDMDVPPYGITATLKNISDILSNVDDSINILENKTDKSPQDNDDIKLIHALYDILGIRVGELDNDDFKITDRYIEKINDYDFNEILGSMGALCIEAIPSASLFVVFLIAEVFVSFIDLATICHQKDKSYTEYLWDNVVKEPIVSLDNFLRKTSEKDIAGFDNKLKQKYRSLEKRLPEIKDETDGPQQGIV